VIVVPDTNQFHADPRMRQRLFGILLGAHFREALKLVLPEAVMRELPKLFGKQVEEQLKALDAADERLNYLIDGAVSVPDLPRDADADAAKAEYDREIRELLGRWRVESPSIPERPTDELFDQSVAERRPFRDKGRGFRDVVIWESILALAEADDVVFITKNHKDFAASPSTPDVLHPDLVESLAERGLPPDRVKIVPSLERFVERYVPQNEQYLHRASVQLLGGGEVGIEFREQLDSELTRYTVEYWDDVRVLDSRNAKAENVTVFDVDQVRTVIAEAHEIDGDDEISLLIEVTAEFQFMFGVTETEAEWLLAERADVEFDEWRDGYVQGTTRPMPIRILYAIGFDVNTGKPVGDFERIAAFNAPDPAAG